MQLQQSSASSGGGSSGVTSWNGRVGIVLPIATDYTSLAGLTFSDNKGQSIVFGISGPPFHVPNINITDAAGNSIEFSAALAGISIVSQSNIQIEAVNGSVDLVGSGQGGANFDETVLDGFYFTDDDNDNTIHGGDSIGGIIISSTENIALSGAPTQFAQFTVSSLPTGTEGQQAYATDGLKVGEITGSGTGVPVYFSNGSWRVYSTDQAVTA